MSSINIAGDTSGSISLTVPSVAGTNTATLPAATGTIMVSGNQPAFSYYQSSAQTLSSATATKLTFTTSEFDTTGGMYASSRFTPTVAGYYQVNAAFGASSAFTTGLCSIWRTGNLYKNGSLNYGSSSGTSNGWAVSGLVYCNGSTDYIEIYGTFAAGQACATGTASTYFQAVLVRAA